jgi:hypothetical protein
MPASSYTQLAVASIALAAGLFAFSDSFAVAILAFGLLMVGSVALGFAAEQANQS